MKPAIVRLYGLCGGCLVRHGALAVPGYVYRKVLKFFGENVAITEALCRDCWRLLFELHQVDVGLHRLPSDVAPFEEKDGGRS